MKTLTGCVVNYNNPAYGLFNPTRGKDHAIGIDGQPVCGFKIPDQIGVEWATGYYPVTCKKCLRKLTTQESEE